MTTHGVVRPASTATSSAQVVALPMSLFPVIEDASSSDEFQVDECEMSMGDDEVFWSADECEMSMDDDDAWAWLAEESDAWTDDEDDAGSCLSEESGVSTPESKRARLCPSPALPYTLDATPPPPSSASHTVSFERTVDVNGQPCVLERTYIDPPAEQPIYCDLTVSPPQYEEEPAPMYHTVAFDRVLGTDGRFYTVQRTILH